MKKYFLLLLQLVISTCAFSQHYKWARSIGGGDYDTGASLTVDDDGNVYTIGSFNGTVDFDPGTGVYNRTSAGGSDIFVTKLDGNGNFVWARTMGGINDDGGGSIVVDAEGNVYTSGSFNGGGDFDPGPGEYHLGGLYNIFISKLDAAGNFVWAKSFGGDSFDYAHSLALDAAGNVYSTGHFESGGDWDPGPATFYLYSSGGYNIYVLKLDTDGNFVWAKQLGGTSNAQGNSITVGSDGKLYIAGDFYYTVDFDPGDGEYELISAGETDVFILQLDASGNFGWAKRQGGPSHESGSSVKIDLAGNIYTAGNFGGVCDFDPGAESQTLTTSGYQDIFISKLDDAGNFIWAKKLGGTDTDQFRSMAIGTEENIFISGTFEGVFDIDPGPSTRNLVPLGSFDTFILQLNASGEYVWADQIGGYGEESASITADVSGVLYSTGFFNGTLELVPGNTAFNPVSKGLRDIFIFKLDAPSITDVEVTRKMLVEIYPNPSPDFVRIDGQRLPLGSHFSIVDGSGRQMLTGTVDKPLTLVDIRDFNSGLYIIRFGDKRTEVLKFIKQ